MKHPNFLTARLGSAYLFSPESPRWRCEAWDRCWNIDNQMFSWSQAVLWIYNIFQMTTWSSCILFFINMSISAWRCWDKGNPQLDEWLSLWLGWDETNTVWTAEFQIGINISASRLKCRINISVSRLKCTTWIIQLGAVTNFGNLALKLGISDI